MSPTVSTHFPFEVTLEVAFRDIDAFGHVNNAVFLSYMEYGRVKYLTHLFEGTELTAESLLDIPIILVEATCTYRSPALLSEKLTIGLAVSRFGNTSFDLVYRILGQDGRLIATGKTIQVMYDYEHARPFAVPDEVKAKVEQFQGDWQLSE